MLPIFIHMTIIKESKNETVYSLISDIAENIHKPSEYYYVVRREEISISRTNDGRELLVLYNKCIFDNTPDYKIDIVDLFSELPLEQEYRKRMEEHYSIYSDMPIPPPFFSSLQRTLPSIRYKYYYSESMSFQQSTVHDNILPYESTWDINTIRTKIVEDISFRSGGAYANRDEYENRF